MLKDDALAILLSRWAVTAHGRTLIEAVRTRDNSELARSISGCVEYVISEKMQGTVAAPGRNLCAALAMLYEHDANVLEYYFQPWALDIKTPTAAGKSAVRWQHRPEVMLIQQQGVVVQDWKGEGFLFRQSRASGNYYKDAGEPFHWHWRPTEEAYADVGFHYEMHSLVEIPNVLIMNMKDLVRYRSSPPLPLNIQQDLRNLLDREVVLTFRQLMEIHHIGADTIKHAITTGVLCCDLVHERLDGIGSFHLYRDRSALQTCSLSLHRRDALPLPPQDGVIPGALIQFNGQPYWVDCISGDRVRLHGIGDDIKELPCDVVAHAAASPSTTLPDGSVKPEIRRALAPLSSARLDEGIEKLNAVRNGVNIRSARQMARYRTVVESSLTDTEAAIRLAGRANQRGNRTPRLPADVEAFAEDVTRHVFKRAPGITKIGCFQRYQGICRRVHRVPMSYPTFCNRVKRYQDLDSKHGRRAALAMKPIAGSLDPGQLPHGWLPHQCVHIDHTPADVVVNAPIGNNLGRAVVTFAFDACVPCARALYMSFRPASAQSVLMVLRDYVRRWKRLPQTVIVDGGMDLHAAPIQRFAALHGITFRRRAKDSPRQGAPIETQNRAREWQVDRLVTGNTSHLKNARAYAGYTDPKDVAEETLVSLYRRYEEYFFVRKYACDVHPALGVTPQEYEARLIRERGSQPFRPVGFDEHLLIQTAPPTPHAVHRVDPLHGVWTGFRWYWHDAFRTAKRGEKAVLRIEPFHADIVYAEYRNQLLVAVARNLTPFPGRSSYQLEQALRQMYEENGLRAQRSRLMYAKERDVLSLEARHFDPLIGLQEAEMLRLYLQLGMVACVNLTDRTICCADPDVVAELENTFLQSKGQPEKQHSADPPRGAGKPPFDSVPDLIIGEEAPAESEHLALRDINWKSVKGLI